MRGLSQDAQVNYLLEAHASAHRIMCESVRSVLFECAAEALRQRVSKTSDDNITQHDVDASYQFATMIALKWKEKLKGVNDEVAAAINLVVSNGDFLDLCMKDDIKNINSVLPDNQNYIAEYATDQVPNSAAIHVALEVEEDTLSQQASNMIPFVSLSKLVGDADPCNLHSTMEVRGSSTHWNPLPSLSTSPYIPSSKVLSFEQLQPWDQLYGNPASQIIQRTDSYIRNQIKALDNLGNNCHTLWRHDWNIIENSFQKSQLQRKRMQSQHVMEVIPKSILEDDEHTEENAIILLNAETDQASIKQLQVGSTWSRKFGSTTTNKVGRPRKRNHRLPTEPRPPIAVGETSFSIDDPTFDSETKRSLEKSMIHSQQSGVSPVAVVRGALKPVGQIHLWEQLQMREWEDAQAFESKYIPCKKRKKELNKAKKRRIEPFIDISSSTKQVGASKVIHTQGEKNEGLDQDIKRGIELDLGECTIEVLSGMTNNMLETSDIQIPFTVSFRSLELSLQE